MLLKLYKREGDTMLYWEAWAENEEILVHFGELGQIGETTTIALAEFEPPETAILRHAEDARSAGFEEIEQDELFELIVQYTMDAGRGPEFIEKVEDVLNDVLGWTGLGHCDGNDVGEGTINLYCYVVDPSLAIDPIINELQEQDLLGNAVVAYQDHDENFVVLWPKEWDQVFVPS